MKTLLNANDRAEIVRRLGVVGPASQRRWGTMTAAQAICHMADAFRVAIGERAAKPVKNGYSGQFMRWAALWLPFKWPHAVPTVPECDAKVGGSRPTDFERDKCELLGLLERFTMRPRATELQPHPFFGVMTEKEWMRWGYLHADHHLRQFGA
ncbi:MAG: DUF1569 domain-containing protein [Terracidiphilus sp.]|jgi:hypothetical protein